jgi:heme O synthase-like polyprenyltransferase
VINHQIPSFLPSFFYLFFSFLYSMDLLTTELSLYKSIDIEPINLYIYSNIILFILYIYILYFNLEEIRA